MVFLKDIWTLEKGGVLTSKRGLGQFQVSNHHQVWMFRFQLTPPRIIDFEIQLKLNYTWKGWIIFYILIRIKKKRRRERERGDAIPL